MGLERAKGGVSRVCRCGKRGLQDETTDQLSHQEVLAGPNGQTPSRPLSVGVGCCWRTPVLTKPLGEADVLVCGPHFRWLKRLRLWPRSPQNTSLHEGRDFVLFTTASQGLQQCLDSVGSR